LIVYERNRICRALVYRRFDEIYQLAAYMGGAGFIEARGPQIAYRKIIGFGFRKFLKFQIRRAPRTRRASAVAECDWWPPLSSISTGSAIFTRL